MDLKRLTHLVALADERSFVRAAKRVHLSQPAFSRSIQSAEAEYEIALFERSGKEITMTSAGTFVVERARRIVESNRSLDHDVLQFRERRTGDVSIGIGTLCAPLFLGPLLVELRTRHPDVNCLAEIGSANEIAGKLLAEKVDIAIVWAQAAFGGMAEIVPIGRLRTGFYVRPGHPLLAGPQPTLAEILPYGLAAPGLVAAGRNVVARKFGMTGRDLPIRINCDDLAYLKAVTAATDTVLMVTDSAVQSDVAEGSLRLLVTRQFPEISHALAIAYLKGRTLSPLAQVVLDFVTRRAATMSEMK